MECFIISLTPQELFNVVAEHLMTQGQRSVKPGTKSACAYRGKDGLKCAIGALLPDEVAIMADESRGKGLSVDGLIAEGLVGFADPADDAHDDRYGPGYPLAVQLQNLHDIQLPSAWKFWLREMADEWKLELPECLK